MSKLDRIDPVDLASNPRASLSSWQKYEPIVVVAIAKHPQSFVYPCTTLRASTICSRLRDAIKGKIAFDYPSTLNTIEVARWFGEVVFKYDNDNVYIGEPEKIKTVLDGTPGMGVGEKPVLSFPTLALDEILAFSLLLSNNRLQGPVIVKSPPDVSLIPARDNLELVNQPDGSLMLL